MVTRFSAMLSLSYLALGAETALAQISAREAFQSPAVQLQNAESRIAIGEYREAQQSLLNVIDQLEQQANDANPDVLIEAWTRLGEAYAADGLIPLSLDSFETATDLSRRHNGLFNENLVTILYRMEQTARASGDFQSAIAYRQEAARVTRQIQHAAVIEVEKTYGSESLEHFNAKIAYARWLSGYDQTQSRMVYNEALDLVSDHFGDDLELKARVFQAMGTDIGEYFIVRHENGASYHEPYELIRAHRMMGRVSDPDPVLYASILRDIGDWRLMSNSASLRRRASRAYLEAWEYLNSVDDGRIIQNQLFGEPELIRRSTVPLSRSRNISNSDDAPEGLVDLEFEVDAAGRVRDVTVLSADPDWMRDDAIRQLRYSIFRPRIANGELVPSEGQLAFSFRYTETLARNLE